MFRFQTLNVWKKAVDLSDKLFEVADGLPIKYQFSFGEQLRRSTLSITNNIAEGTGRKTKKEQSNFYNIAKGSVYESINILVILSRRSLLHLKDSEKRIIYESSEEICKMLSGLSKG